VGVVKLDRGDGTVFEAEEGSEAHKLLLKNGAVPVSASAAKAEEEAPSAYSDLDYKALKELAVKRELGLKHNAKKADILAALAAADEKDADENPPEGGTLGD
jgi:hypothetical protein